MSTNWYWLEGTSYCPECVECDDPAIDADDDGVTRGAGHGTCGCCKRSAVEEACESLAGKSLDSPEAVAAFRDYEWQGYYPVVDGSKTLTGEFVYADEPGEWVVYDYEAAIYLDEAREHGWTVDVEEGTATPPKEGQQ